MLKYFSAGLLIVFSFKAYSQDQYQPQLFGPGIISTPNREWTNTFTPDGNTVYFTQGLNQCAILFSKKVNGSWQAPEIASFSGTWMDTDPYITGDGKRLYFASVRPADQKPTSNASKNAQLWYVDKIGDNQWSEPVLLDAAINYPGVNTWYPSESKDGNFYFHSWKRPGGHGKNDIYVSKHTGNQFSKPVLIPVDTASFSTQEARISKNDDFMIFVSDRPGGMGPTDLYIAFHKDTVWSKPLNLGPAINRGRLANMAPGLSADEKTLYFTNGFMPVADVPVKIKNPQQILNQMTTVYNGLWNIFYIPLNLEELRLKAKW